MNLRRTVFAATAVGAAGVASVFGSATSATAQPVSCEGSATLISGNICELTFTEPTGTFTSTATMGHLEALLVGGGGSGGYGAHGGGGGQVLLLGFAGEGPATMDVVAGLGQDATAVVHSGTTTLADNGTGAFYGAGGNSGTGFTGAGDPGSEPAGGGGAGASPVNQQDGGAGVVVSSLATPESLFANDNDCFGGGGAGGITGTVGVASCGGGQPADANISALIPPAPNSGGGGGAGNGLSDLGARGRVTFRWLQLATVTFDMLGHGEAVPQQTLNADAVPQEPAAPTETGWNFNGWFTDSALTSPADFTQPIGASTTLYASWSQTLAATGVGSSPSTVVIGLTAALTGSLAVLLGYRRKRRTS